MTAVAFTDDGGVVVYPGVAKKREAATYLGISEDTVDALLRRGLLERVSYCSNCLIPWASLYALVPAPGHESTGPVTFLDVEQMPSFS